MSKKFKGFALDFIISYILNPGFLYQPVSCDESHDMILENFDTIAELCSPCDAI